MILAILASFLQSPNDTNGTSVFVQLASYRESDNVTGSSSLILVMSYPKILDLLHFPKKLSKIQKSSEFHNFASTWSCVASRVSRFVSGWSSLQKSCFRNRPGQWGHPTSSQRAQGYWSDKLDDSCYFLVPAL